DSKIGFLADVRRRRFSDGAGCAPDEGGPGAAVHDFSSAGNYTLSEDERQINGRDSIASWELLL
ncbi:MAG TPA: hypothetical protein VFL12_01440, partial [Thermoanaerobaculia bacterium]|nr:hypothetical protein [Thermoanaerobaculia bacterium]